jgi:hypothetical protein
MATLCLGLAWAGGAVQGQDSPPVVGISIPAGDSMALANAIFQANGASSDDSFYKETIYLAGGTYAFSFPGNAQQPQLPPIHANITLHGNGAVIELYGQAETAALMPLRIQPRAVLNLHHTTVRAMRGTGRAVFNAGVLTLTDSRLTTGAQASGGGIQNDGTLTLLRSSIEGARAATGINPGGAVLNIGSLTATCSKFINNEASQGGAIYNAQGGQLGAENNLFLGNKANGGGAIFNALANPTLILPNNFFGAGGAPAVDEYYAGTDTISQRLSVTPLAASDPTTGAGCAATPPLPAPASGLSNAGLSALRAPELNVFEQPDLIPQALSYRDNNNVLSVLLPNGQSVAEPSLNSAEVFDTPRWSPDGSKVAYASNQSGNMEIFVLDLASGQTINLSNDADSEDSYPVWSADGSRVMFGVQREGIRIVSVLGRFSGQAAIGAGEAGSNVIIDPGQPTDVFIARPYLWGTFRPIWSADQRLIYYGVDGSVYSVDMNNRQAESLVLYPGWSILPDGRITRFAGSVISPSPTGSDILFGAQLHAVDDTFIGRPIFLVRGDGSGQRLLLTNFVEGQVHRGVTWFPDSQHVLFAEGEGNDGPYQVYKVAVYAGGAPVSVYSSATWSRPAWRPSLQGQVATPTPVAPGTCRSDVASINIRKTPSLNGDIVHREFKGEIRLSGQYVIDTNGNGEVDNGDEIWYRVADIPSVFEATLKMGWVAHIAYSGAEPCDLSPDVQAKNLPLVDFYGNSFILPTLIPTVTPNVTATPNVIATPVGTITPAGTVTPSQQTCTVTIANRTIYGYATAVEALSGKGAPTIDLNGKAGVVVDLRSIVNGNIVHATVDLGNNVTSRFWFYSADGDVVEVTAGNSDCSNVPIESESTSNYAIRIVSDVSGINETKTKDWSRFEQYEIMLAVNEIGRAFTTSSTVSPNTPVDVFNRVFASPQNFPPFVLVVRADTKVDSLWKVAGQVNLPNQPDVTVTFTWAGVKYTGFYEDVDRGSCKAFEARLLTVQPPGSLIQTTVKMPSAIVCNGALANVTNNSAQPLSTTRENASQYTIVHEFGHIFDYLSNNRSNSPNNMITDALDNGNFVLGGCLASDNNNLRNIVMGFLPNQNWKRGRRGWGSAPQLSTFLQNKNETLASEAAADMFLNWVYRVNDPTATTAILQYSTTTDAPPTSGCVAQQQQTLLNWRTETWRGFHNRAPDDDKDIATANRDWALSGDIRQALMSDIVKNIFSTNGW